MGRLRSTSQWSDPRVKPPFGSVEVDWEHPLNSGLRAYWVCNEGAGNLVDIAQNHPVTLSTATTAWAINSQGPTLNLNEAAGDNKFLTIASTNILTLDIRVMTRNAGALFQSLIGNWILLFGQPRWSGQVEASTALTNNVRVHLAITMSGTAGTHWTNGAVNAAFTSDGASQSLNRLGADTGFGTLNGHIDFARVRTGAAFSADRIAQLYQEPFAGLRPIIRRRYFIFTPAAAPTGGIFIQEHVGRGVGRGVFAGR